MYAKLASLEKGLVGLQQKWEAQDEREKQNPNHSYTQTTSKFGFGQRESSSD